MQTLIERFEETSSVLSGNRPRIHYVEHLNGYSNSREFDYGAHQSTLLEKTKHATGQILQCTNRFQQFSFQNGHETGDYSSGYVNRDQNESSNANVRSDGIGQTLIEPQCNGQYRYNFEDPLPTDGQAIAPHPSNIRQSHEDHMNGHGVNSLPNEMVTDSTETTQERFQCVDAENNFRNQCTDHFSCDGNYKLVLEAIEQLENYNQNDQQQLAHITTTIDTQMNTPAREHLEAASTHQTVHTGIKNTQMDTPALGQPSKSKPKESPNDETLNASIPLSDVIGNKIDHTKRPGNNEISSSI